MQINIREEDNVIFVRGELNRKLNWKEVIELAENISIEFRDCFIDRRDTVVYMFYLHLNRDDFIAESFIKEKIVKKLFTK